MEPGISCGIRQVTVAELMSTVLGRPNVGRLRYTMPNVEARGSLAKLILDGKSEQHRLS
jgi:hypothetical protein